MSDEKSKRYVQPDYSLLNQDHVQRYLETGGEIGHLWNGATALLLTMTGRKSGKLLTTPLIYASDGDDYIVIASKGGAPTHPAWYLNISQTPEVEIQVKDKVMKATASTVHGAERERLWEVATRVWPNFDQYAERTDRQIPVVKLTPHN